MQRTKTKSIELQQELAWRRAAAEENASKILAGAYQPKWEKHYPVSLSGLLRGYRILGVEPQNYLFQGISGDYIEEDIELQFFLEDPETGKRKVLSLYRNNDEWDIRTADIIKGEA